MRRKLSVRKLLSIDWPMLCMALFLGIGFILSGCAQASVGQVQQPTGTSSETKFPYGTKLISNTGSAAATPASASPSQSSAAGSTNPDEFFENQPVRNNTGIMVSNIKELNQAVSKAKPGDVIVMKNGEWKNTQIEFYGKGTSEKPITLCAETPGKVILTGSSTLKISGEYMVVDGLYFRDGAAKYVIEFKGKLGNASHCRLTNTAIFDYNFEDKSADSRWVSLYGTYNRVDHCFFKGKRNQGMMVEVRRVKGEPDYHLIDNNYFGYYQKGVGNGAETIRIGTSTYSLTPSYTVVERNLFELCNGEIETISNKSCNNIYRYNTFYKNGGALTLRHGNDCIVEGNWFLGENLSGTYGIRVIGENHKIINNYFYKIAGDYCINIENGQNNPELSGYWQVKNALIANNTMVDVKNGIMAPGKSGDRELYPENVVIADNVLYNTSGRRILMSITKTDKVDIKGNVMFGGIYGSTNMPKGIMEIDPKLEKDADGIYRPAKDSPLINSGTGKYVETDIDGQARNDGKNDIGADEVGSGEITNRPLTIKDVGPDWVKWITDSEDPLLKPYKMY